MKSSWEQLGQSSGELNQQLDHLNETFQRAEDLLQKLCPGIRAEAAMPAPCAGSIAFGKLGKKWRLLYIPPETSQDAMPLSSASREIRLQAASMLPDLVAALARKAEEDLERVREAIACVTDFCEALLAPSSATLPGG